MAAASKIPTALKGLRKQAGISVREMAAALALPTSTYQWYEGGYKKPYIPPDLARGIAQVLAMHGIERDRVMVLAGAEETPQMAPAGKSSLIDELDVSAGNSSGGREHDQETIVAQWQIPADMLRQFTAAPAHRIKIIRCVGDSNIPVIMPEDRVLIDLDDVRANGDFFAVGDAGGLRIKRLNIVPGVKPPIVTIQSAASNRTETARLADIAIKGRVVAKWGRL